MKEKNYLVDSNIFIYHLNNEKIATDFLLENRQLCSISRLTYIEVLSFNFDPEVEKSIKAYLEQFNIIDTNQKIAYRSIENRKTKRIKLPDNIIASTAQANNLILVTRNTKDFKSLEIETLDPFENSK